MVRKSMRGRNVPLKKGSQAWGRRQSDNQAYPKDKPEKDSLPRGLEVVKGTRRKRRALIRQDMSVGELSGAVDSYLYQLSHLIQRASSRAEAEEMYDEIKQSISVEIADLVWDDYVDWEKVTWGTADREHNIALAIPVEPRKTGREQRRLGTEASLARVHGDYTLGARYPPEDFSDDRKRMDAPIVYNTRRSAQEDVDDWFKEGYTEDEYTKEDINVVRGRGIGDMGNWKYGWIVVKRFKGHPRRPER